MVVRDYRQKPIHNEPKTALMDNLLALPIGTELAGDYRIRQVLGAGGFGITYLAEETPLNRGVAIKEYFPSDFAAREGTTLVRSKSRSQDEDYRWGLDRFIEEAQALATFDHTNIVRVYRYFRQNNTGYMVLKLEPGRSFKGWLDGLGRRPSQQELDAITAPLLDALEVIHERSFLHRDIAPDNIIIRPDGSPVLIDFGSARREVASHMRTMSVLVKPGYSPVEQYAQEGRRQGPWSDIYALAATLYHAVTGKRPADAPARMQTDDLVPAAVAAQGSFRPGFLAAIDTAMSSAIEARPQSVAQWRLMLMGQPAITASARKSATRGDRAAKTRKVPVATRKLEGETPAPIRLKARKPVAPPPPATSAAPAPTPRAAMRPAFSAQAAVKLETLSAALAPSKAAAAELIGQARQGAAGAWRWLKEAMPQRVPEPVLPIRRVSLLERLEQAVPDTAIELAPLVRLVAAEAPAPTLASTQPAPAGLKPASAPASEKPAAPARLAPVTDGKPKAPSAQRSHPSMTGLAVRLALVAVAVAGLVTIEYWSPLVGSLVPRGVAGPVADVSLIRTLRGHAVAVDSLSVTSDGAMIASAGADGQILIWDSRSGAQLRAVGAPGQRVTALASSEHVVMAGMADGAIGFWQMDSGERLGGFEPREGAVLAVTFLSTSKQFATASDDTKLRLWDSSRGIRWVGSDHKKPVLAIAYNLPSRVLATGGADKLVKLWDERRRRLIRSYEGHTEDVRAVALSPDGTLLASASNDKTVILWSTASDARLRVLEGHSNRVVAVAFSPDGRMLASGSEDGTVKLWDANSGALLTTFTGHVQPVRAVAFLADGHRLASAGDDMTVRLWNVRIPGYP